MEIIYSSQKSDFIRGRVYQNPRFFDRVKPGVTSAIVVGDYPKVVAALERDGIPYQVLKTNEKIPSPGEGDYIKPQRQTEDDDEVNSPSDGDDDAVTEIPDNFASFGMKRLREFVAFIDPHHDVANKREALKFIRAYKGE